MCSIHNKECSSTYFNFLSVPVFPSVFILNIYLFPFSSFFLVFIPVYSAFLLIPFPVYILQFYLVNRSVSLHICVGIQPTTEREEI